MDKKTSPLKVKLFRKPIRQENNEYKRIRDSFS